MILEKKSSNISFGYDEIKGIFTGFASVFNEVDRVGDTVLPNAYDKEIKAWANGAEIEWWNDVHEKWENEKDPMWSVVNKYRIKPQLKEPQYINVYGYLENQNVIFRQEIGMPYIGKIKLEVDDV